MTLFSSVSKKGAHTSRGGLLRFNLVFLILKALPVKQTGLYHVCTEYDWK